MTSYANWSIFFKLTSKSCFLSFIIFIYKDWLWKDIKTKSCVIRLLYLSGQMTYINFMRCRSNVYLNLKMINNFSKYKQYSTCSSFVLNLKKKRIDHTVFKSTSKSKYQWYHTNSQFATHGNTFNEDYINIVLKKS